MEIGIFNETDNELDNELNKIEEVLKIGLEYLGINEVIFDVIIIDNLRIKEINLEYRGIDKETDVISFALEDDNTFISPVRLLGDIYISIDKAKNQALEYNHSLIRELSFLSVHGLLHLLGYNHMSKDDEKEMFKLQEEILNKAEVYREN